MQAKVVDGRMLINDRKSLVMAGGEADYFLLTARFNQCDELGLFLLNSK